MTENSNTQCSTCGGKRYVGRGVTKTGCPECRKRDDATRHALDEALAAWRGSPRYGVILEWFAEETAKAHRYSPNEDVPEAMSAALVLLRAAART